MDSENPWALENAYQQVAVDFDMAPLTHDQVMRLVESNVSPREVRGRVAFLRDVRAAAPRPLTFAELWAVWENVRSDYL